MVMIQSEKTSDSLKEVLQKTQIRRGPLFGFPVIIKNRMYPSSVCNAEAGPLPLEGGLGAPPGAVPLALLCLCICLLRNKGSVISPQPQLPFLPGLGNS